MLEEFLILGIADLGWALSSIAILAIALIVVSTGQFASLGIAASRAAFTAGRRRQSELRGLRQSAEIARLKSELRSSKNETSVAWRVMEVAEVVDESADCRSYYLVDAYRQPLPAFRPGQHVLVRPAMAGAYQTTRCYSLSHTPDERYWRITVKHQPVGDARQVRPGHSQTDSQSSRLRLPPGQSGGLSGWLHGSIAAGDCLLVGGPSGHFFLSQDNPRALVLLAAGVGVTPLASMLLWSQQATPQRPIRLLYQVQDLQHWPLGQALHESQDGPADVRVVSYFSRATSGDLALLKQRPPGEMRLGKFQIGDVLAAADGLECDYYMCGPDAWMEAQRHGLRNAGVQADRIHWESFGSSTAAAAAPRAAVQQPLSVQFERSGVAAHWSDPQQTLWELARQHEVAIRSGCLSGVCGGCRVKLLAGKVDYDRPVAIDLPDDECLACVARPTTACCVDV